MTKDGQRYPSAPSSGDVHHRLPGGHCLGQHSSLCTAAGARDTVACPCRASFLAACCTLVYEAEPVICDVLTHRWTCQPAAHPGLLARSRADAPLVQVGASFAYLQAHPSRFAQGPGLCARHGLVCSNKRAWSCHCICWSSGVQQDRQRYVHQSSCRAWTCPLHEHAAELVLILGQVPTSQPPCLSTQVSLDSSHCSGLLSYCLQLPDAHPAAGCGRMTDGFVRGLEQRVSSSTEASVYEELQAILLSSCDETKEIFLTGHSIGGAGIVTFAQLLAVRQVGSSPWRLHLRLRSHLEEAQGKCLCRNPDLAQRITGIFTYGAPRVGDEQFSSLLRQRFMGRLFRYVNCSDMVCKLPHVYQGSQYVHHCGERFITSFTIPGLGHRQVQAACIAAMRERTIWLQRWGS